MRKKQSGFRKPSFKRRANGRNLFDHVENSLKRDMSSIRGPVAKGKTLNKHCQNSFALLEESDTIVKYIALPKVVESDQPLKGSWANKLGSKKPVEETTSTMPGTVAILESLIAEQKAAPSYIGAWADACDSDSDSEDEEEIVYDSIGRPSTDNSAW